MLRRRMIKQAVARLDARSLPLHVHFWDGSEYAPKVPPRLRMTLRRPEAMRELATPTLGGLARAYVEELLDLDGDLCDILGVGEELCGAHKDRDERGTPLLAWLRHTRPADRRNISHHYDVSNDFFALWLDSRRVYSCAYFRSPDDTLDRAQEQKLDLICRKLMLKPGERMLDIGCGWGGLIFWAAERYGTHAVGITLSAEQHRHVSEEIERRGLAGQVEVRLQDYREVPEDATFDKIASVGMFEHVGRNRLDRYFAKIHRLLKPGGLVLNHGITAGSVDSTGLRNGISDFVDQYVFPGGELVHVSRVVESIGHNGFECLDVESLRPHYARTLWHWVQRLDAAAARAREIVGERQYRVWRIYMAGSAHAFARGWLSVHQILAGRPLPDGRLDYPYARDHLVLGDIP